MDRERVKGKVVVVVGASSGLGRATSLALARAGAEVVACARSESGLAGLEQEVRSAGGRLETYPLDVRDRPRLFEVFQEVAAAKGRIDVLIYAAGTNVTARRLEEVSPEDWEAVLATNVTGAFQCTQAALAVMRKQEDGLIIYVSSVSAKRGDGSGPAYQASKRAIDGIVQAAMAENEGERVRFTLLYPGVVDTPLLDRRPKPPTPEARALALQSEDIAELCLYLVSTPSRVHVREVVLTPKAPLI